MPVATGFFKAGSLTKPYTVETLKNKIRMTDLSLVPSTLDCSVKHGQKGVRVTCNNCTVKLRNAIKQLKCIVFYPRSSMCRLT